MKDPLDQEKPWGVWGTVVVITLPIALVYFVIRLAVVVPEWGWQVMLPLALLAPCLYYFLAFSSGMSRKPRDPNAHYNRSQRRLQLLLGALLGVMALVPLWFGVYYFWNDALPW